MAQPQAENTPAPFVDYRQSLCAHSRGGQIGCRACVDVCSVAAIASQPVQQRVQVDAQRCLGCGACSTVCPTGALKYTRPGTTEQGVGIKRLLSRYQAQGGRQPALLLHGAACAPLLQELAQATGPGADPVWPERVLPLPVHHSASTGLDVWLSAICHGASQVWVLMSEDEAAAYAPAVRSQMDLGQAVLSGLGYAGRHFGLLRLRDARDVPHLQQQLQRPPAQGVTQVAGFAVQSDKRATLELALAHLLGQAPRRPEPAPPTAGPSPAIALPAGAAPWGGLVLDAQRCTLCLACVSTCPAHALSGTADLLRLAFTERACVQCGLCVRTCPEQALTLRPQLNLAPERTQAVLLNQVEPYTCVRCGKPFGTRKAVEMLLTKLGGHPMFQGAALDQLKMCDDCRGLALSQRR